VLIGIIGAGHIGAALAARSARAGVEVRISNSRGPRSLVAMVSEIGPQVTASTVAEAAEPEIVVVAVPWASLAAVLPEISDWDGRIVVDATNPGGPAGLAHVDPDGRQSSEIVAGLVPGAHVVKAFNTLPPRLLSDETTTPGGRRVIFFSGDHVRAKLEIARFIGRLGFFGVDLGRLAEGGKLQSFPGGPLIGLNLVSPER
jgi:predicted dinucleotide-binding enzyme